MTMRITIFTLLVCMLLLGIACGSSSQEKPNSEPADSTTTFDDSTAAA